jgi:hypothetical protein
LKLGSLTKVFAISGVQLLLRVAITLADTCTVPFGNLVPLNLEILLSRSDIHQSQPASYDNSSVAQKMLQMKDVSHFATSIHGNQ